MAEQQRCGRHGTILVRNYSLSSWQPVGDPYCPAWRQGRKTEAVHSAQDPGA